MPVGFYYYSLNVHIRRKKKAEQESITLDSDINLKQSFCILLHTATKFPHLGLGLQLTTEIDPTA